MDTEAVIFDNDGVIVDSEQYWRQVAVDLFQDATAEEIDPTDALEDALGMNYRDIYDLLADRYTVTMDKETFLQRYEDAAEQVYTENVEMMDGFHELLDTVREHGCNVAIASSSPRRWLDMVVDRFDLEVDEVVSADALKQAGDIDAGKPDPGVYQVTARRLGVDPERCLVVEDSTNGIRAANRAGMVCIGYRNESDEADATAATPQELREEILDRL